MGIFDIIIIVCLIMDACLLIVSIVFYIVYSSDTIESISNFIEKRKRKKIIKKLKEMPTWDETCINLLKNLSKKEENDGN